MHEALSLVPTVAAVKINEHNRAHFCVMILVLAVLILPVTVPYFFLGTINFQYKQPKTATTYLSVFHSLSCFKYLFSGHIELMSTEIRFRAFI